MLSHLALAGLLAGAGAPDTVRLVLVATTDVHGHITDWDYLQNAPWPGGLTRVATVVDSLRERYPGQVIVVDAGDALQGSPLAAWADRAAESAHPIVDAMNTLGYDAATPGAHDFDFGMERFNQALAGSGFPWVSANLRVLPQDTLALAGYTVILRNGVKVAITGFTTPAATVLNRSRLAGRLRVDRVEPGIARMLREARKDADLVIVLAHSGMEGRSSHDTTGLGPEHGAARLAQGESRPDLVVVGYSHETMVDSVLSGVHFVQPRPQGRSVAVVHIALVPQDGKLVPVRIRGEQVSLEDVRPAPRLARRLGEIHRAVLGWVSGALAESDQRLTLAAARVEDTPLLRYLHAVLRRASGAQLSALAAPDLRAGFDAGEITMAEVFRLYPAEHTLRVVKLSGAQLRAFLEQSARYFYADSTGRVAPNRFVSAEDFDLVGGATWALDLSQRPGSRITRLEVRGRPVAPEDSFTLALTSYRQQGGGNYASLGGARVVYDKEERIRDLIVADLSRRRMLRGDDFAGADWALVPVEFAQRARALFVREPGPAPPPPEPEGRVLPAGPSRAELARRDSIARAEERAAALARATVVTMRLPAGPGAEGGLARLVADAYRNALRTDLALVSAAELRGELPAGPLTAAQVDATLGPAALLTITLTGAEVRDLLENLLAAPELCCGVSGIAVEFDPRGREFDRVRRARLVTGADLDRKRSYTVALSEAHLGSDSTFALGAGDCRAGKGCRTPGQLSRWTVTRSERGTVEVLREYLRRLPQPVAPPTERRMVPRR